MCIGFPLGDYSKPCDLPESGLICPIRADWKGEREHQLKVQVVIPGYSPDVLVTSHFELGGKNRRMKLIFDVDLETIHDN